MPRIKLELPDKKLYSTSLTVRISDVNYGGHVGNQVFLAYAHDVRLSFLKSIDQSELDFFGASLIMSDSAIVYRKELFHGDTLEVELYSGGLESMGFDLYYLFKKEQTEVARVKTGLVFFDYQKRKITTPPKEVKEIL